MRVFDRILEAVATLGFIGMLVAAWLQVVFRYVLELPVPWTEELARVLFVLTMFLGITIAIRRGEHIVISFLLDRLPGPMRAAVQLAFDAVIVVFLIVLAIGCWGMMRITWNSYMIALDWLRTGELFLFELGAVGVMILYVVLRARAHLVELRVARLCGHEQEGRT